MITILTVNYNSHDFLDLLVRTRGQTPVLVVENSTQPARFPGVTSVVNPGAKTHGAGLNFGLGHVQTPFVLVLDADCHLLPGHDLGALAASTTNVITVKGSPQKPIRPAFVFLRTERARSLDWRATPGYKGHRVTPDGADVGILAYREMVAQGLGVKFLDVKHPSRYGTLNGEEYWMNGSPLCYHHWHGTHLRERAQDYPGIDLLADKAKLFAHFKKIKRFL